RPVVAIAVGGVREIVEVGATGWLSGPNDWESVGHILVDMLAHPEKLPQIGQAGRKRVEERFDLRTSVRRTTDLFRTQLGSAPSRRDLAWTTWPVAHPRN